jgi:hypothetical protein
LLFCCLVACTWSCLDPGDPGAGGTGAAQSGRTPTLFEETTGTRFEYTDPAPVIPRRDDLVLDVLEPRLLAALEQSGYQMAQLFSREEWGVARQRSSNEEFHRNSPWYHSMVNDLAAEIAAHSRRYGGEYIEVADLTDRPRRFSPKWLSSRYARFELIAVVNRLDRMELSRAAEDAAHAPRSCGEVRFVYRLAYDHTGLQPRVYSRLPFTFNMVYEVPRPAGADPYQACVAAARAFRVSRDLAGETAYLQWLAEQPLDLARMRFKQVEVNFQVVRLTSGGTPTLGGHAEYILRIFRPEERRMVAAPLENTPDVERLRGDPALRRELVAFLRGNLAAIDRGTVVLPDRFLTRRAISVSTSGLHRLANRPFTQLLDPADLDGIDFAQAGFIDSPEALLMRLDDLTCQGCHQSNSVAGFHLVGRDRARTTHPLNAARVAYSPHYLQDRQRRLSYSWMLAREERAPGEFAVRPLAFQKHKRSRPGPGDACFTAAALSAHFKGPRADNLGCAEGLECVELVHNANLRPAIGTCLPPRNRPVAGLPCWRGEMIDSDNQREDDFTGVGQQHGCSGNGYRCFEPVQGTPGGMCYNTCAAGRERDALEACAYNGGERFDRCAARGNFAECIRDSISRGLRMACDENTPCRDDFICQSLFDIRHLPEPVRHPPGSHHPGRQPGRQDRLLRPHLLPLPDAPGRPPGRSPVNRSGRRRRHLPRRLC